MLPTPLRGCKLRHTTHYQNAGCRLMNNSPYRISWPLRCKSFVYFTKQALMAAWYKYYMLPGRVAWLDSPTKPNLYLCSCGSRTAPGSLQ